MRFKVTGKIVFEVEASDERAARAIVEKHAAIEATDNRLLGGDEHGSGVSRVGAIGDLTFSVLDKQVPK